jgi:topoisomerase-4 subunit A
MQIRTEQSELAKEREELEKTLASSRKLKTLIRNEIEADAKKYGDARKSPIVERKAAEVIEVQELLPTEPLTVILSQQGWIRAAKGHDIDPTTLSYKAGDSFKAAVKGRSNQSVIILDSSGRSYALPAHTLPSARGQGEPLTGRLSPEPGVSFDGMILGDPEQMCVVASDAGYGFIVKLEDLLTKNRSGKAALKVPKGAKALSPKLITNIEDQYLAAVTNVGKLLLFPLADLPILPRGKGNKIIGIPSAKAAAREEYVVDIAVLSENNSLTVYAGKREFTLQPKDLANYQGSRGQRGNKLPKALRQVDRIEVI